MSDPTAPRADSDLDGVLDTLPDGGVVETPA